MYGRLLLPGSRRWPPTLSVSATKVTLHESLMICRALYQQTQLVRNRKLRVHSFQMDLTWNWGLVGTLTLWLFAAFGAARAVVEIWGRWQAAQRLTITVQQIKHEQYPPYVRLMGDALTAMFKFEETVAAQPPKAFSDHFSPRSLRERIGTAQALKAPPNELRISVDNRGCSHFGRCAHLSSVSARARAAPGRC